MTHELKQALALIRNAMWEDPSVAQKVMDDIEEAQRSIAQARYTERLKQNCFPL